jgi:hypothetical protein
LLDSDGGSRLRCGTCFLETLLVLTRGLLRAFGLTLASARAFLSQPSSF